jgi:hypothetical protein
MPPTSYKDAFEKIQSVNEEIDQKNLVVVKSHQKQSRFLFWLLMGFALVALAVFVVLVNQGLIKFYKEQVPTSVSLVSAKANDAGQVRIILEVQEFNREVENPNFMDLRAHLFDHKSGTEYKSEVIPVFLENGSTRILIMNPDLAYLPGPCDIELSLVGKENSSNVVQVKKLDLL